MGWKNSFTYDATWNERKVFDVADGDHIVTIQKAEDVVSKQGKNMIHILYEVEGSNGVPCDEYIVEGEYFDKNASRIFDVFKIARNDWNYMHWQGKKGYAHFAHKEESYTGNDGVVRTTNRSRIVYFHNSIPQPAAAKPDGVQALQAAFGGTVTQAVNNGGYKEDIPF